jgi:hypothetical protein
VDAMGFNGDLMGSITQNSKENLDFMVIYHFQWWFSGIEWVFVCHGQGDFSGSLLRF